MAYGSIYLDFYTQNFVHLAYEFDNNTVVSKIC